MKYLISPDGFWKINETTDQLFWWPVTYHHQAGIWTSFGKWVLQCGVKASESNAIKQYPEISEEEIMLELL